MSDKHLVQFQLSEGALAVVGERPLFQENLGRSGADVMYAGEDLVIKAGERGSLVRAARMQRLLWEDGLAPEVVYFESGERDVMISRRAPGESASESRYCAQPERLAFVLGRAARRIHETDAAKYASEPRVQTWIDAFWDMRRRNAPLYGITAEFLGLSSPDEAVKEVEAHGHLLKDECVVHGDLCLPNYMLDDFAFAGLIDTGDAGLGDRHYDLFWSLWSLSYNLKTKEYGNIFLDAYGRSDVDERLIRTCGCLCALDG